MSRFDEHAERVAESLRRLLATNRAGVSNRWYTPLVQRMGGFGARTFEEFLGALPAAAGSPDATYIILPGDRKLEEYAAGRIKVTADYWVLACRRFEEPTDQYGLGTPILAGPWTDAPLVVLGQPLEPGYLRCLLADIDQSVTGGVLTVTGTDQNGNPLVLTWTPTVDGYDARLVDVSTWAVMASVTSASIAGATGGGANDTFRVGARADRWTIQERLAADVGGVIREMQRNNPSFGGQVDNVENVQVIGEPFTLYTPGWAVVDILVRVDFVQVVGCP